MNKNLVSKKGLIKLQAEYLAIDARIQELKIKLEEKSKLDENLRENKEFTELKIETMFTLPAQKEKLYWQIRNAVVIEETPAYKKFDGKTVIVGSTVSFSMNGVPKQFTILGTTEVDLKNGILACDAPIAVALLGKKVDDYFSFNGKTIGIRKVEKYKP